MSTTIQGVDARTYLGGWATALAQMTGADIKAIPADKWEATHGGCTRSAQDISQEIVALLEWTTNALKGNVAPDYTAQAKADCSTQERAVTALNQAVENFNAALAAASDEALNTEVMPPWQMPAPLFILANIAVSHIWYHDGQLNYIQALLGDEKVHWMGD